MAGVRQLRVKKRLGGVDWEGRKNVALLFIKTGKIKKFTIGEDGTPHHSPPLGRSSTY